MCQVKAQQMVIQTGRQFAWRDLKVVYELPAHNWGVVSLHWQTVYRLPPQRPPHTFFFGHRSWRFQFIPFRSNCPG
jgi:hypothetical protein